jgi:branched-chain amino acid transport system ATP-binding protein
MNSTAGPAASTAAGAAAARAGEDRLAANTGLLVVDGIHTYYGKSHILHSVSLEVGRGEVVGLLGRNGVGKSTTLKAVAGIVHPSSGEVRLEGNPVTRLPPHRLARLGIGYVPEDRRIFPFLTVLENLRVGLDRHGVAKTRKIELLDKVYSYFPVLAERRNQAGGTLSGGEQQMLAIARAMMLEPKIILLDEPTEGLMPRMISQIRDIIDVLHREGVAVLLVEQNVPLTLEAARRVYFIEKGEVRYHALASELHVDDPVIHQYLGV